MNFITVSIFVWLWLVFGLMFRAAGFGWRAGWLFAAFMAAGLGASAAFYLN